MLKPRVEKPLENSSGFSMCKYKSKPPPLSIVHNIACNRCFIINYSPIKPDKY
ncbi:hypothetical protein bcgnr5390_17220 [Bacillus luti]|nr:hypothetical protein BC2903_54480 [Bacillus cereus]